MTLRYERREGVLVEAIGPVWAAFSPATGETTLLNDESAAVLEVLENGAASSEAICAELADDCGLGVASLAHVIEACWPRLIEAGLVREQSADRAALR